MELIEANDKLNFDGLIDIGEYFGTGQRGSDVASQLYFILERFEKNPALRLKSNKDCLDHLCNVLHEHCLTFAFNTKSTHPTGLWGGTHSRHALHTILFNNDVNDLMVWATRASQEDLEYGLRVAACTGEARSCFLFMLRRTINDTTRFISLLTAGQPSGQIAMHRAISSGITMNVAILMDPAFNPSDDLFKQLIVPDKKGLTPVDCIKNIPDRVDQIRVIGRIRTSLDQHGADARFRLTQVERQSIYDSLNQQERNAHTSLEN